MKKIFIGLLGASILSTGAAYAASNPYSGFVTFGDSLVDAGQLPDIAVPGQTLRFTNRVGPTYSGLAGEVHGKVSSTLLGERLGISDNQLVGSTSGIRAAQGLEDGENWAVGGYTTNDIYNSITAANGSTALLRKRDGYVFDLLSKGRLIDSNTMFYISGGGNDILNIKSHKDIFDSKNTQISLDAATNITNSVSALQQAGGRYFMVWMLPDLGQTPFYNGGGNQDKVSSLSNVFNVELIKQLSNIDAQVIALNIPKLLNEAVANPNLYDLSATENLVGTCFNANKGDCIENTQYGIKGATPDPSKLLFNDSVHPTITGQRLIADYGHSILAAPWELTLLPEMARTALNQHQRALMHSGLHNQSAWQANGQWNSFAAVHGERTDYRKQKSVSKGDSDNYALSLGGSYRVNEQWRAGLGLSLQESTLTVGAEDSKYGLNSYMLSPFVQYSHQALWADANLSFGLLDYDSLHRKMALSAAKRTEKGDSKGSVLAVNARVGYQLFAEENSLQLSPFISMSHARLKVDDYAEKGDNSTALTFGEQKRTSKRLGLGLLGSYQLSTPLSVNAEIAYDKEFSTDRQQLDMHLNSVASMRFKLQGYKPDSALTTAGFGARYAVSDALSVQGNYNYMHADSLRQHGAGIGVNLNW